jgi:dienelactone hydrolase
MVPVVVDGQTVRLEMRIYKPARAGPVPTLVFNHGSTGRDPRLFTRPLDVPALAQFFVQRGWAVVMPARRGRAGSEGLYDEGFALDRALGYTCDPAQSLPGADRALRDIAAAMDAILAMPFVDRDRVIIGGQSRGGILSVAYAGQQPEQIKGVINFVGGWLGTGCPPPARLTRRSFSVVRATLATRSGSTVTAIRSIRYPTAKRISRHFRRPVGRAPSIHSRKRNPVAIASWRILRPSTHRLHACAGGHPDAPSAGVHRRTAAPGAPWAGHGGARLAPVLGASGVVCSRQAAVGGRSLAAGAASSRHPGHADRYGRPPTAVGHRRSGHARLAVGGTGHADPASSLAPTVLRQPR